MTKHPEAELLLEKYKNGTIDQQELEVLEAWYNERAKKGIIEISDQELNENLDRLWQQLNPVVDVTNKKRLWKRLIAAASVTLIVSASLFLYQAAQLPGASKLVVNNDIAPGGNNAYLTLANGKKLLLRDAENGTLAKESGVTISKSADGQLVYTIDNIQEDAVHKGQYNTIETPRGGQYQIVLPDGTRVWLNAASSLKYPVRFSNSQRAVELIGEAYFEVAKDSSRPFVLNALDQVITVLGTHFNVNSYTEEKTRKTTLLEGAVRISSTDGRNSALLKPGQEYESADGKINVSDVNASESIAWKNGEFVFNDEPLESIMNKIARWYDVNIIYENIDPSIRFGGTVGRFTQVSKVLEKLQLTGGVGFRITGRNVTVTK